MFDWTQLLGVIVVTFLTTSMAWLFSGAKKETSLQVKLTQIEAKIDALSQVFTAKIDSLESRVERVEEQQGR